MPLTMSKKHTSPIICVVSLIMLLLSASSTYSSSIPDYFIGVSSGFGSTTWSQIVTPPNHPKDPSSQYNPAVLSAPIGAKEGGMVWRLITGKMLLKNFSIQAEYTHFPKATFTIDAFSLYPQFKGKTTPTHVGTKTDSIDLIAKYIVTDPWMKTVDTFADIGVSYTRRRDMLDRGGSFGAEFGLGIDYELNLKYVITADIQVNTGFGKSELLPADDYVPFVYSAQMGITHYFNLI